MKRTGVDLLQFLVFLLIGSGCLGLPSVCKPNNERKYNGKLPSSPEALDRKVVCSNMELDQVVPPGTLPNWIVTLDLKNNLISNIEPGAFLGMSALKRLDLSNNKIGCLNADMFKGLQSLLRLEFQTPFLLCDCNLVWLIRWLKERSICVRESRCSYPRSLQSQLVTDIKPELLTCDAPLEIPSFQMTPSHRQIVFEGDSLPFQCKVSYIDQDMQVLWYQDGKMVEPNVTQGIFIKKSMVQNCSLIESELTISNIQSGSTGNWECRVRTSRGNNTRTVHIVVLESSAQYCPPEKVVNNKGNFRWPRTFSGITAYHLCARYSAGSGIFPGGYPDERRAWRRCDRGGFWAEEDYSRCQYENDVTHVLYIINQMPINLTNAVTTARQLLAYTVEAANFSDKMDVIFVADLIEKFGRFAEKYKEDNRCKIRDKTEDSTEDEAVLKFSGSWFHHREGVGTARWEVDRRRGQSARVSIQLVGASISKSELIFTRRTLDISG
ncbi:Adhesion G protein-coupled receptor A3 [Acipenser ruthenus]|uniref:Adhesion G protein-coupled receptor A3 n=1 Tax=Acipenser ruthenus TaxID=7906 RepID=A0A444UK88_ACIRT|nr:Adhesion G protein-coupled receptor A3 [Acipenser ruthenus]